MTKSIKKSKGAYVSEDGGMFATIGFNPETNRYEGRIYLDYGDSFECVKMFAHSARITLVARPTLQMMAC